MSLLRNSHYLLLLLLCHTHMITEELKTMLVDFIDDEYPKGHADRGFSMCCIALFMMWLEKHSYDVIKK